MAFSHDLIGQTILKTYTIRARLGGGGFGEVYQADQLDSHRVVAIKIELKSQSSKLACEYKMYQWRDGMDGIPKVYGFFF
jgi:serine/threonine protein kinase